MHHRTIVIVEAILIALLAGSTMALAGSARQPGDSVMAYEGAEVTPAATPTGSSFTYQGSLKDGTNPANGQYDLSFSLYDAVTGGNQVGTTILLTDQSVVNGLFTVALDFGASAFDGNARYLKIAVKPAGIGRYITLSPRQRITAAPYALFAQYALKSKGYKNVVTVAQDGGDYTSIMSALNSIQDNSSTNRYLVWVGPGTYTEKVQMKSYVDIEGAGEGVTKITSAGGTTFASSATLQGQSNSELRSLTVENTGGNTFAVAIFNTGIYPSLLQVTAAASQGITTTGVYNDFSSPTMTNMTVSAAHGTNAYGVYNYHNSSPTMTNMTVSAAYGNYVFGVYNRSDSSPSMNNMVVSATYGVYDNYGIENYGSAPNMTNMTVTASNGGSNSIAIGVFNNHLSSPVLSNVIASASQGSSAAGVTNMGNSSVTMTNVTATGSGGQDNYGFSSWFNWEYAINKIDHSTLTGSTSPVSDNGPSTTKVGESKLSGGPASSTVTCAGVYDENYVFFPSTCP
jgi:Pectinesterase